MNVPYTFPYVITGVLRQLTSLYRLPYNLLFLGAGILLAMTLRRKEKAFRLLWAAPALWLVGEAVCLLNNTVLDNVELAMWSEVWRWALLVTVGQGIGLFIRRLKNQ